MPPPAGLSEDLQGLSSQIEALMGRLDEMEPRGSGSPAVGGQGLDSVLEGYRESMDTVVGLCRGLLEEKGAWSENAGEKFGAAVETATEKFRAHLEGRSGVE